MREIAFFNRPAAGTHPVLPARFWQRAPALCGAAAVALALFVLGCVAAPGGVAAHPVLAAAAVSLLPLMGLVWAVRLQPRAPLAGERDVTWYAALAPAGLAALATACFLAHAALGGLVHLDAVHAADTALLFRVYHRGGPEVEAWAKTISAAGGPLLPALLALLALGLLCLLRQPRSFVFYWSTVLASLAVPVIFKVLFHRQRPFPGGQEFNSYPSGHTATAAVVAGALLVVLLPRCRTGAQRAAVVAGAAAWPALMAASRMSLGCHYLTDVAGGMLLGSAWVAGCLAAWLSLYRFARRAAASELPGRSSR